MGGVRGADLPDDLIRLILVKLPVKCLLRLRLVSKTWLQLINCPTFIFHHHSAIMSQRKSGNSDLGYMVVRYPLRDGAEPFFSHIWVAAEGDPNLTTSKQVNENIHLPFAEAKWEKPDEACPIPLLYPAGFGLYCVFEFETKRVALWNPSIRGLKVLPSLPFSSQTCPQYGFGQVGYKDGRFSYV
uniref:F-box domain-containing protein n=1 Tax=Kalanchoe fedtschenkoi TaxID=63787 RepID=A0A7N0ZUN0_KALFE